MNAAMPHAARHILVVDDMEDARELFQSILEFHGFDVEVACNGREALDAVNRTPFFAVLTDMWMPVMTGSEFVTQVRSRSEAVRLPIIVMSSDESLSVSQLMGTDAYLRKPFPFQSLHDLLTVFDSRPS